MLRYPTSIIDYKLVNLYSKTLFCDNERVGVSFYIRYVQISDVFFIEMSTTHDVKGRYCGLGACTLLCLPTDSLNLLLPFFYVLMDAKVLRCFIGKISNI